MTPSTYHNNEKFVRVCDNCNYLTDRFCHALISGDLEEAKAIFEIGNVNAHTLMSIFEPVHYPLHLAVIGE
jgi:hypothetical protein